MRYENEVTARYDISDRPVVFPGVGDFLRPRLPRWDPWLMDQDDPQKRIAELERQLAEQKRVASDPGTNQRYKASGGWLR